MGSQPCGFCLLVAPCVVDMTKNKGVHNIMSVYQKDIKFYLKYHSNPILDTRISFVRPDSVTLVLPPLDSEIGYTGELWSNREFLILEN